MNGYEACGAVGPIPGTRAAGAIPILDVFGTDQVAQQNWTWHMDGKTNPEVPAINAPSTAISLHVSVLYGFAMPVQGCGKCSSCHKGMRIGCHEVNHR
jgi:hypothetical protein